MNDIQWFVDVPCNDANFNIKDNAVRDAIKDANMKIIFMYIGDPEKLVYQVSGTEESMITLAKNEHVSAHAKMPSFRVQLN
jgi:hypothetical protein